MRWSGATGAIARCKRVSTGCGRKRRSVPAWPWICGVKPTPKAVNKPSPHSIVHGLDKPGVFTTVSKISPKLPESGLWLALDRRLRLGEGSVSGVSWDDGLGQGVPHTSALDEERRWVVMNNVPQMNARRMTLTFPV